MTNISQENAIEVHDISKSYRLYDKQSDRLKEALHPLRKHFSKEFHALKNLSFSILKGETVGIIGKNGSGKSTLLQILCGILLPSTGSVLTDGKISSLLELGTGFNPEYTGIENIFLNASIMGLTNEEINNNLDKIIGFADIGEFIKQPVKTYSSGMYVRLAFAIQANINPDILIVDEALAVGDAQFVHRCMLRFHQMQQEGKTIILVTHDSSAVKTLCSRALWLDKGRMKGFGPSSNIIDNYINDIFSHSEWEQERTDSPLSAEQHFSEDIKIPTPALKFDQRLGDGSFEITGCNLCNSNLTPIFSCNQNQDVLIYLKFANRSSQKLTPLVGLILKDPKGIEIASSISRMENFNYPSLENGRELETLVKVNIPRLYPGPYSITPTISYINQEGDQIGDRLVNAIVFEIVAERECHTLLSLETAYELLDHKL